MFDEPQGGEIALFGVNEFMQDKKVTFKITDMYSGMVLHSGEAVLGENSSTNLGSLEIGENAQTVYLIEWILDGVSYKNHYTLNVQNTNYDKYLKAIISCGFDNFAE